MKSRWLVSVAAVTVLCHCTGTDPVQISVADAGDAGPSASLALSPVATTSIVLGTTSTVIPVTIVRTALDGPVTIAVSGLPDGVNAASIVVAPGATTGSITILTSATAVQNDAASMTITATADGVSPASTSAKLILRGKPGELDTTFGAGGTRSGMFVPVNSSAFSLALTADDHLYVVAESPPNKARVARLLANGQNEVAPYEIALDGGACAGAMLDGSLLVAGTASGMPTILHYAPTGELDGTFNANQGKIVLPGATVVNGFAALTDGFATVSGATSGSYRPGTFAKYTLNGQPDGRFGSNGSIVFSPTSTNYPQGIGVGPTGKIFAFVEGSPGSYGFTQVTANGQLDTSFGTGGTTSVTAQTGLAIGGTGGVADADGSLFTPVYLSSGWLLAKFDADGKPDAVFGITDAKGPFMNGVAGGMVMDKDGNLVVGVQGTNAIQLVRFTKVGSIDHAFGNNGTATITFPNATVNAARLVLQSDGRIVGLTNVVGTDGRNDPAVFRFWP